jgi:hypothetical protein
MSGVQEEAAEFRRDDAFAGPARFRRLADTGPVYEVVAVGPERLKVRWIDQDDVFELPRAEAELDALA